MKGLAQWKGWALLAAVSGIAWISLGIAQHDRTDIVFGLVFVAICSTRAVLARRTENKKNQ